MLIATSLTSPRQLSVLFLVLLITGWAIVQWLRSENPGAIGKALLRLAVLGLLLDGIRRLALWLNLP